MTLARLVIATIIITGFTWLYWCTGPLFGVFRLNLNGPSFWKRWAILAFMENQTCVAAYSLDMLATGWSIIRAGWPFVLAGLLIGLAVGYPVGELMRRKFAVEQLSRDAVRLIKEIREDAHEIELLAQNTLETALSLCEENWEMRKRLEGERQEIQNIEMIASTELEAVEGFRKKNATLHAELVKAKAKIQRLEKKLELEVILKARYGNNYSGP